MKKISQIILLLIIGIASLSCRQSDNKESDHVKNRIGVSHHPGKIGIDVSHHQGKIDWKTVAKSGRVSFVYVKVTEGARGHMSVDPKGAYNIREARKYGLNVGAYHMLSTLSDIDDQFANFKAHCPKGVNLIPVLDYEKNGKFTSAQIRRRILEFSRLVEKEYGVKPIIYTSVGLYNNILVTKKREFKDYIFFLGYYRKMPKMPKLKDNRKKFLLQYTDKEKVPGVKHRVDGIKLTNISLEDLLLP